MRKAAAYPPERWSSRTCASRSTRARASTAAGAIAAIQSSAREQVIIGSRGKFLRQLQEPQGEPDRSREQRRPATGARARHADAARRPDLLRYPPQAPRTPAIASAAAPARISPAQPPRHLGACRRGRSGEPKRNRSSTGCPRPRRGGPRTARARESLPPGRRAPLGRGSGVLDGAQGGSALRQLRPLRGRGSRMRTGSRPASADAQAQAQRRPVEDSVELPARRAGEVRRQRPPRSRCSMASSRAWCGSARPARCRIWRAAPECDPRRGRARNVQVGQLFRRRSHRRGREQVPDEARVPADCGWRNRPGE